MGRSAPHPNVSVLTSLAVVMSAMRLSSIVRNLVALVLVWCLPKTQRSSKDLAAHDSTQQLTANANDLNIEN